MYVHVYALLKVFICKIRRRIPIFKFTKYVSFSLYRCLEILLLNLNARSCLCQNMLKLMCHNEYVSHAAFKCDGRG